MPGEWLCASLLATNLGWSILCLGGYRPETQLVGYSLCAALVVVHLILRCFDGTAGARGRFFVGDGLLACFLALAAANVLWVTPVPWLGWIDFLCWAQMLVVYWMVRTQMRSVPVRRFLFGALLLLSLISAVMAIYQKWVAPEWLMLGRTQSSQFVGRSSGSFGIPNSLAALIMLVLPATTAMACRRGISSGKRIFIVGVASVLMLGFYLTLSRGGWLSLALAAAVWPLLSKRLSVWRRLGWSTLVILASVLVVAALYLGSSGVRDRLDAAVRDSGESTRPVMWRASWLIFKDAPVMGGGAGSFNTLFERHRPEECQREPQWAHNEYLNTLSDYGLSGFVLFFGGAACLVWSLTRSENQTAPGSPVPQAAFPPRAVQGMGIGLLAFALQLFVDFHFKLPGLALSFAVLAGIVAQPEVDAPPSRPGLGQRLGFGFSALACALFFAFVLYPVLHAESLRYTARQRIDKLAEGGVSEAERRAVLGASEGALERSVCVWRRNAQAWTDLSYVQSLWSRERPSDAAFFGHLAEVSARRALTISPALPEAWMRLGVALDMQGRWIDAGQEYIEALQLAPSSINARYYLAFHYSLKPMTYENARGLIDICLRLDPSHGPVQALKRQLESTPEAHK